jgi:hypothetical protein
MAKKKYDIVQTKNPRTGLYVKINRTKGTIKCKKKKGTFKNVPII